MRANHKAQKQKIINSYVDMRNEAFKEVSVDVLKQTVAIVLGALRVEGSYTDDQLREMYEQIVHFVNTPEIMGHQMCSTEITDVVVKTLGIDLDRLTPKVGD